VSVLFAIADEQTSAALIEAHENAAQAAFRYIERQACFTRRGGAAFIALGRWLRLG
jgi:hypothetical protein